MAGSLFLDTNGWLALLNSADALHGEAAEAWANLIRGRRRIDLTDWIVAETGNGMARARERSRLEEALERILRSPRRELVIVDEPLLRQALEFFGRQKDKNWGLVDCCSFLVMQDRGITDAFTSDRHFQQEGFRCLLTL